MVKSKKLATYFVRLFIIFIAIVVVLQIMFLGVQKIISWIPNYLILLIVILTISYFLFRNQIKSYFLMRKYDDQKIVDRIMKKILWEGAKYEHIIDTYGRPESIDLKILRGKKREILKYDYDEKRKTFLFRITLENDNVIGWENLNITYKRTKLIKPITLVDYA